MASGKFLGLIGMLLDGFLGVFHGEFTQRYDFGINAEGGWQDA